MIHITDTITLDENDIQERFVRAAGDGGMHLRRNATAVRLQLDLGKLALPPDVRDRLVMLAGRHMTKDGVLLVDSRSHRSQTENRDAARGFLLKLLRDAAEVPEARRTTRPRQVVQNARREEKQAHRALKRARRGADED